MIGALKMCFFMYHVFITKSMQTEFFQIIIEFFSNVNWRGVRQILNHFYAVNYFQSWRKMIYSYLSFSCFLWDFCSEFWWYFKIFQIRECFGAFTDISIISAWSRLRSGFWWFLVTNNFCWRCLLLWRGFSSMLLWELIKWRPRWDHRALLEGALVLKMYVYFRF